MPVYACTYFSYVKGNQLQVVEADTSEQAITVIKEAHDQEANFLMRRVFNVTESLVRLAKK